MQTYFVRRQGFAADANQLHAALSRLQVAEETANFPSVRWLHSYAVSEADGRYGLACVLRADDADSVQRHAGASDLPVTQILPVAATVLLNPMPARSVFLLRGLATAGVDVWQDAAAHSEHTRCLRTYVIHDDAGTCDRISLYQSPLLTASADCIARGGIAIVEIVPVIGRVVYRDET